MKKQTSIVIGLKDDNVLLGLKKSGHGEGYWNGFGGKKNEGETITESALREVNEEAGIIPLDMKEIGIIDFTIFETYIYVFSDFRGAITESDEMKPQWFNKKNLPYDKMWEGDKVWFPLVIAGRTFDAKFTFDGKKMTECNIKMRN